MGSHIKHIPSEEWLNMNCTLIQSPDKNPLRATRRLNNVLFIWCDYSCLIQKVQINNEKIYTHEKYTASFALSKARARAVSLLQHSWCMTVCEDWGLFMCFNEMAISTRPSINCWAFPLCLSQPSLLLGCWSQTVYWGFGYRVHNLAGFGNIYI